MKRLGGSANRNATINGMVKRASALIPPKLSDGMKSVSVGKTTEVDDMKDDIESMLTFGLGIVVAVMSFILALIIGFKLAEFVYGL